MNRAPTSPVGGNDEQKRHAQSPFAWTTKFFEATTRRLAPVIAACALLAACGESQPVPTLTLKAPRAIEWNDFLGVNAQFHWFPPEVYKRQMQTLHALGLSWVRLGLQWELLEPEPGKFRYDVLDPIMQAMRDNSLKPEVYLVGSARFATTAPADAREFRDQYPPRDADEYARTLAGLAQRYPDVAAWQVWNEPNLPGFWRPHEDPDGYARLFVASAKALHAAVQDKPIVLGGFAYFGEMGVLGGSMIDAMDARGLVSHKNANTPLADIEPPVVAYHPYTLYPEGNRTTSREFVEKTRALNARLRMLGATRIWADEWGWSSYAGPKEEQPIIGADGQADFLLRRLALMSTLDFDRIFLFTLSDLDTRASVRDRNYGLLDLDAQPKPAYLALQRFLAITGPRLEPADAPTLTDPPSGLIGIAWTRADGHRLLMFWAADTGEAKLAQVAHATLHDPLAGTQRDLAAGADGALQVPVTRRLALLEWTP